MARKTKSQEPKVETQEEVNVAEWEQTIADEVDSEIEEIESAEETESETQEEVTEDVVDAAEGVNGTLVIGEGLISVNPSYFPEYTITREDGLIFFDLK